MFQHKTEVVLSVIMLVGIVGMFLAGISGLKAWLVISAITFVSGGLSLFVYYLIQELEEKRNNLP